MHSESFNDDDNKWNLRAIKAGYEGSRYLLCILLSQRIHQLEKGAPPAIDVDPDEYSDPKMFLKLALMEIIEGNMEEQATIESA